MLLLYVLLFLPVLVAAQESQPTNTTDREMLRNNSSGDGLDWIGESFLNAVDTFLPVSKSYNSIEVAEGKAKKLKLNKYVVPLIVGIILIKSILLPITLKTLAILSGKAVVLSLMSLILAAIVGLKKVARENSDVHKLRRQDTYNYETEAQEFEPYRFYKEQRRKK
ncbi:uncharacterized protein [Linepithema humile]|uniref:uncharacterized protein n=1 Tax=Linepithema humile TaxID=83485 RepID=UPI00351F75A7